MEKECGSLICHIVSQRHPENVRQQSMSQSLPCRTTFSPNLRPQFHGPNEEAAISRHPHLAAVELYPHFLSTFLMIPYVSTRYSTAVEVDPCSVEAVTFFARGIKLALSAGRSSGLSLSHSLFNHTPPNCCRKPYTKAQKTEQIKNKLF